MRVVVMVLALSLLASTATADECRSDCKPGCQNIRTEKVRIIKKGDCRKTEASVSVCVQKPVEVLTVSAIAVNGCVRGDSSVYPPDTEIRCFGSPNPYDSGFASRERSGDTFSVGIAVVTFDVSLPAGAVVQEAALLASLYIQNDDNPFLTAAYYVGNPAGAWANTSIGDAIIGFPLSGLVSDEVNSVVMPLDDLSGISNGMVRLHLQMGGAEPVGHNIAVIPAFMSEYARPQLVVKYTTE